MQNIEGKGAHLSIQVIGSVRASVKNSESLQLPNKAMALLIYFALTRKETESKEFIKGLLWSESSQKRASGSLRQCLKKLNDTFSLVDFRGFTSSGNEIRLNDDSISVDIIDLHEGLQCDQLTNEMTYENLNMQDFLNDLDIRDHSFETWVHVQRQNWSSKLLGVLEEKLRADTSKHETKLVHARLLYALDQTHEEACRFLMEYYARRDNLGPVMEMYSKLCSELDEKYGAEPSPETIELYLSIQTGNFIRNTQSKPQNAVSDDRKSAPVIGINAFQWSGTSSEKEALHANFFRNELMAALSKFREWVVVDTKKRTQADLDATDIDYLLDGTCYQIDNFTDVLITLTDSVSGQVWSENSHIETKTWISTQRSIVSKIAVALNVYLSTARLANTISQKDFSSTTHEEWLKGYQNMLVWDPISNQNAERIFRNIIEQSPQYAPAYSSLATVLNTRQFKHIGISSVMSDVKQALDYAQTAVELDPLESRTQLALGFSLAMNDQFEQAQLHLTLARELNPYSPVSVVPCAHGLSLCGLHNEAVELVDWAENVNWRWMPQFHWGYISCVRFFAKDFKKAISAAKLANGVIIDLHAWHAAALALDGQIDAASQELDKFVRLVKENWYGTNSPDDSNIANWFLNSFPIKLTEDLDLLKEGLALAGLANASSSVS